MHKNSTPKIGDVSCSLGSRHHLQSGSLGSALWVKYDWNFWDILMVPWARRWNILESIREKGPGKTAPQSSKLRIPKDCCQQLPQGWGSVPSLLEVV